MRSVPGEEPLTHPIIYKYRVKLYHTELQGRDVQLFSQFWGRVVDQLRQMVRGGTLPHLDDGTLQDELRDAAMAQINHLWLHELTSAPASAGAGSSARTRRCLLCHDPGHLMKDHPADRPITVPCPKCKALHAFSGPLKTPCSTSGGLSGVSWSSGPAGKPSDMSSTQPAPDSLQRAVLSLLIDRFGDRAEQVLRTCTAMGATAPDDLVDLPREWGVGRLEEPSPACLKLMCRQVAAATGTLTRVTLTAHWESWSSFLWSTAALLVVALLKYVSVCVTNQDGLHNFSTRLY